MWIPVVATLTVSHTISRPSTYSSSPARLQLTLVPVSETSLTCRMSEKEAPRSVPVMFTLVSPSLGPLLGWIELMTGAGHASVVIENVALHSSLTVHSELEHHPQSKPAMFLPRQAEHVLSNSLQLYKIPGDTLICAQCTKYH